MRRLRLPTGRRKFMRLESKGGHHDNLSPVGEPYHKSTRTGEMPVSCARALYRRFIRAVGFRSSSKKALEAAYECIGSAIEDLEARRRILEPTEAGWHRKVLVCMQQNDPTNARVALVRRNHAREQLARIASQCANLEMQRTILDDTKTNRAVVSVLYRVNRAMRKIGGVNLERVEKARDNMQDRRDDAVEVSDVLAEQNIVLSPGTDEAIELELAALASHYAPRTVATDGVDYALPPPPPANAAAIALVDALPRAPTDDAASALEMVLV